MDCRGAEAREQPRVPQWSDSLAVGRRGFVERAGAELGVRAQHRQIVQCGDIGVLRDPGAACGAIPVQKSLL
jgi:hypothetical protein